jgi:heat shock protein HslJ
MACTDGMEVEAAFLGALTGVRTYEATDSTLVLEAQGAPLMRLRRPQ